MTRFVQNENFPANSALPSLLPDYKLFAGKPIPNACGLGCISGESRWRPRRAAGALGESMGIFKAYKQQQSITDALREAHAKREKKAEKLRRKAGMRKVLRAARWELFKRFLTSWYFINLVSAFALGILVCLIYGMIAK